MKLFCIQTSNEISRSVEYNWLIFTEHEMVCEEWALTEKNSKWQNISGKPGTLSHLVKRFTGEKY